MSAGFDVSATSQLIPDPTTPSPHVGKRAQIELPYFCREIWGILCENSTNIAIVPGVRGLFLYFETKNWFYLLKNTYTAR